MAAPGAAPVVNVQERRSTQIRFLITPPAADGGSPITGYVVYHQQLAPERTRLIFDSFDSRVLIFDDLDPDSVYLFTFMAVNVDGFSPPADALRVSTLPVVRPRTSPLFWIKYDIRFYDHSGKQLTRFDVRSISNLKFDVRANDISAFSAGFRGAAAEWIETNLSLPRALDYFVEIYRLHPITLERERVKTFLLRYLNVYFLNDVLYAVIGGVSLEHLLSRRLIDPSADSRGAGGYVTEAGESSRVIAGLVERHCGALADVSRRYPHFSVTQLGIGESSGGRWQYDDLLKVVKSLANKGRVQFDVVRTDGANLLFRVGKLGVDRRYYDWRLNVPYVLLKRERGSLRSPSLTHDYQKEKNVVFVRGSGDDENEILFKRARSRSDVSPYNLIEYEYSAERDDDSSSLRLLTDAVDSLEENKPQRTLNFEVSGDSHRRDWDLHDFVSVAWRGVRDSYQIKGLDFTVTGQKETISVNIELSDEPLVKPDVIRLPAVPSNVVMLDGKPVRLAGSYVTLG